MSIDQHARPKLLEPGLAPFVPGLERHRAPGGGACIVSLAPGDTIALTDDEGGQRCEVVVLGAGGGADFGALGLAAGEPARGLAALAGDAGRMVAHGEDWLKSLGVRKVNLLIRETNTQGQAFDERIGYDVEPRTAMARWIGEKPTP